MTRSKAYEVLGIESNASIEEIKSIYAELSKKYHPEENPEEFQQIYEAYSLLVRGNRTRRETTKVDVVDFQMRQQHQTESNFDDGDFSKVENEGITYEELPQFDFDSVENQVRQEIPQEFLMELKNAIERLDEIIPILNDKAINPNILKSQLEKLDINILLCPSFVSRLYNILYDREVDVFTYNVLVEQLRLWDEVLLQEREDLVAFRAFIDEKNSPEQKRKDRNAGLVSSLILLILGVALLAIPFLYNITR